MPDPETCGWNYVEGLRLDSNSRLALFWDKEGLSEMGARLPEGGHYVSFVGGPYKYVPASRWDAFLEEQRRLLAEEKTKRPGKLQSRGLVHFSASKRPVGRKPATENMDLSPSPWTLQVSCEEA